MLAVTACVMFFAVSCKKDHDSAPVPSITAVNPQQGKIGDQVTITGVNFSSALSENAVTFSGVPAIITSANTTQIVTTVPTNAVTGPVVVVVNGQMATGPAFTVVTPVPLTVASFTPTSGLVGSDVTLTGTGFSTTLTDDVVKVNGVAAVVKSATATQLVITIPAGATTGPITVEVKDGKVTTANFTVTPPLTVSNVQPLTGPKDTEVTITGSGFSTTASDNKVTFNGKDATVKSATATSLVVAVPTRAGTGKVSVTLGRQQQDGPTFEFVYTYTVSTIAGGTLGSADGTGTAAQFSNPSDLTVAKDGNIYITEINGHLVRKMTPEGVVTTFAGSTFGYGDDANPLNAKFGYINGITQDNDGNFYISDGAFIRKIDTRGAVTTLAGSAANVGKTIDGTGSVAGFNGASFVELGPSGNLFVGESSGNVVRKVTLNGEVTTIAGKGGVGNAGFQDGAAATAQFNSVYSALEDSKGDVYISDYLNRRIRKLSGGNVTTFIGDGTAATKDGPVSTAELVGPAGGMAFDSEGNLFFADFNAHVVRRISASGDVSTIAGKPGSTGTADGPGADARFHTPGGLAFDANGNLYLTDNDNNAIRKIIIE
jgi:hypothetical protein